MVKRITVEGSNLLDSDNVLITEQVDISKH
jgi:hypothetical protein